jgi:hypothetical protein
LARTSRLAANLLLLFISAAIVFAATELVLRARWEPRARTLSPLTVTATRTSEYHVGIQTNTEGFRDPVTHVAHSQSRVAVIGDSFVFGSGVGAQYLFTSVLVTPFVDVWNFGVPGTGPFNALHVWRDHARRIKPSIVIVAVYAGNDASDALRESRETRPAVVLLSRAKMLGYRLRNMLSTRDTVMQPRRVDSPAAQGWNAFGVDNPATTDALLAAARERGVPEDSVRARLATIPDTILADALAFRSNPFNVAEAVLDPDGLRHNLMLDTPRLEQGWTALESALGELNRQVQESGATLALVCIPAAVQVDSTYWWLKNLGVRLDDRVLRDTVFQDRLATFAQRESIPMLDLLPVMRANSHHRVYFEQDGHWTAAGHYAAARAIAEWLDPLLR